MNVESRNYDGRCPICGSEELHGSIDSGFECMRCQYVFIVVVSANDAFDCEYRFEEF